MVALVKTLVACGVLAKKKPGPQNPRMPEESLRIQREQRAAAMVRRKAMIEEAQTLGLPPPVFTRGRPRIYTEEEALERKRLQWKLSTAAHKERLRQGAKTLRERALSSGELVRWPI